MSLIFSLSNRITKLTGLELPRLSDTEGQNPGVQPIVTHSTQISWQFQAQQLEGEQPRASRYTLYNPDAWLIMALEAYSRYTLMKVYPSPPSWPQIEEDFKILWLEQMLLLMNQAGVVDSQTDIDKVVAQFFELGEAKCFRNLDRSIGGHVSDNVEWLKAYLHDEKPKRFDNEHALTLSQHLNQLSRQIKIGKRRHSKFIPSERFLLDSLHRFAKGLCKQKVPGSREGNFPNPHRAEPKLEVINGERE